MSDFTIDKEESSRQRCIKRHNNENWTKSGTEIEGWWSYKYVWSYPTKEETFNHIKRIWIITAKCLIDCLISA